MRHMGLILLRWYKVWSNDFMINRGRRCTLTVVALMQFARMYKGITLGKFFNLYRINLVSIAVLWISNRRYFTPLFSMLKTIDTFSNVKDQYSHLVCLDMHKITNLWKFGLIWSSKLRENNERNNTIVTKCVCFQMLECETSADIRMF